MPRAQRRFKVLRRAMISCSTDLLISIDAIGLSTHSTSKSSVLSYVAIFENLWKQSELYPKLKESNENLRIANQKLEINDKILSNFIHSAAHELRNPIQPILGISQIIKTKLTHTEGRELDVEVCSLLDVIIRNARKLHRLTDDVLDTTRIETNSLHLKKETFNLKELMQVLVENIKVKITIQWKMISITSVI
jgi:signal transduction histidine kinase